MTRQHLFSIAMMGALVLGGCDGKGGSTQTCTDCGPFGDFLGAMCDYIDRCPDAVYPIAYRNRDECIAILNFALTCRLRDDEVNDVHNYTVERIDPGYDPEAGRACIAWLEGASCDAITGTLECGTGEEDCEDGERSPCDAVLAFMGEDDDDDYGAGPGESCESDSCRSGLTCSERELLPDVGAYTCRVCLEPRAEGEDCSDYRLPCAEGLVCRQAPDEVRRCLPLLGDGETCQSSNDCLSEFCNTSSRTCDPGGREGDPCLQPGDCREGYCDAAGSACAPFVENGGACTDDVQCLNGSCDDGTGICGLPDGSPCSAYSDAMCASGNCDDASTTCVPAKPDGESCQYDVECQSGYCNVWSGNVCTDHCYTDDDCLESQYCSWDTDTCQDRKPDGSSCEDDEECLGGLCDMMAETCGPKPTIGDPCTSSYACYPEGFCSGSVCVERKDPGESCESFDACKEPFICMDGRCRLMNLECRPAEPGEMCAFFMVCEEGAYCDMGGGITCRARKRAGETCTTDEQCMESLMCLWNEGEDPVCAERKGAGETCTDGTECAEGLFCILIGDGYVCDPGPEGRPCDEYEDPCPEGYFCDNTCQVPRGPGEDCSSWEPCQEGLWCDTIDGCQPPRGLGEECRSGEPCATGLYCDSDYVCRAGVGEGQECSPYYPIVECLEGLYCDTDGTPYTCARRAGTGEPCDDGEECLSGLCEYSFGCLSTDECVMP